ncbi:MAG: prephenate dehydrogenase/arogenate dehydrogenase family protein [Solirubrobacteraceae bacterium]
MRIAVIGVGLIGGSIGLAARDRLGATVTGYDPEPRALEMALSRGALDEAAGDLGGAVRDAEAVFVAAPVGALPDAVAAALDVAGEGCVVSDVGSTKREIVSAVEDPRFVGGHPLAGAESSGVEHARGDLFEGATWYLTPIDNTSGVLYERLHRLLRAIGARPAAIDPEAHDAILAVVSHLPHVLANALVGQAGEALSSGGERLPATGPSFRDATRVAGAPSSIWTDIYLSNADALSDQIEATVSALRGVAEALRAKDREWITDWNDRAASDRARLIEAQLGPTPLLELRASVPNRPGVVAQLALELGRAGVNIVDLALHPAPDMSEGVIAFWVSGENDAGRAADLVRSLGYPVVIR